MSVPKLLIVHYADVYLMLKLIMIPTYLVGHPTRSLLRTPLSIQQHRESSPNIILANATRLSYPIYPRTEPATQLLAPPPHVNQPSYLMLGLDTVIRL